MNYKNVKKDITVIGGGLAGVCAAISAARNGKSVSLVQNRGILGGNSSSEIRVWVCGATKHGVKQICQRNWNYGRIVFRKSVSQSRWKSLLLGHATIRKGER